VLGRKGNDLYAVVEEQSVRAHHQGGIVEERMPL
jgi:hypothetical protein